MIHLMNLVVKAQKKIQEMAAEAGLVIDVLEGAHE